MRPRRLSRAAVTLPIVWLAECALESLPESGARDRERPLWPSAVFGSGRSASLTCEEPEAAGTGRGNAGAHAAPAAPPGRPPLQAPPPQPGCGPWLPRPPASIRFAAACATLVTPALSTEPSLPMK